MAEVTDPAAAHLIDRFDEARPTRTLGGLERRLAWVLAVALAIYAILWVVASLDPQIHRIGFLAFVLVLIFLLYPGDPVEPAPVGWLDRALAALSLVVLAWPVLDFREFLYRAATPSRLDIVLGAAAIALVLEATRRTVGWVLPTTALLFLLYAHLGPLLELVGLGLFAHRGYLPDRLVGSLYMTLEGMFGVPLDVAATYIALFTIYGAVLEASGAGRFFIDWAMAAMGRSASAAAPGRAVTAAGFLLGTVSGSGVATTVTLGSVSWPLLRQAGYSADVAGGMLAAAGIGALLSPPTLGAAAFLIAEYLRISYLQVLVMATIPTLLYYLSAWLMIEADARRMAVRATPRDARSLGELTVRYGHHFASLFAIVAMMAAGMSVFRAVLWATAIAVALSFVHAETALTPRRLLGALESAGRGVLSVGATTATAGIIVGVVTLTGLGLEIAGIIVALAGGQLAMTVMLSAVAVWVLGLAVPVTASYIIAAVMVAPALTQVGVPAFAAHMFIFYYAVLSEVSPPTALSPFAAAALTGGNPFRTMMLTWKYTLPAFLVPFVFVSTPEGSGLLMRGSAAAIAMTTVSAAVGVAALAFGIGGWMRARATMAERAMAVAGGLALAYADVRADLVGVALVGAAVAAHLVRTGRQRS